MVAVPEPFRETARRNSSPAIPPSHALLYLYMYRSWRLARRGPTPRPRRSTAVSVSGRGSDRQPAPPASTASSAAAKAHPAPSACQRRGRVASPASAGRAGCRARWLVEGAPVRRQRPFGPAMLCSGPAQRACAVRGEGAVLGPCGAGCQCKRSVRMPVTPCAKLFSTAAGAGISLGAKSTKCLDKASPPRWAGTAVPKTRTGRRARC